VLILLPPSEGKTAPTRGRPLHPDRLSFASLDPARAKVLAALVCLCTTDGLRHPSNLGGDLAATGVVLAVGKTLVDEVARNAHLTSAHAERAERVYTGVLYEALAMP